MDDSQQPPVRSRCVGVCTLNTDGICIGCHRDVEQISDWANASADERKEINRIAAAREQQMKRRTA